MDRLLPALPMTLLALALAALSLTPARADRGSAPQAAPSAAAAPARLAPDAALKALQEGNARFAEGRAEHPRQGVETREHLAAGQAPEAIVVGCSDSRVPPETVFDQGLGDLFTVRAAGNVLDQDGTASIEYAIEYFGTRLIVILGHESCGAVHAALATPKAHDAGSPNLNALVAQIQQNLGPEYGIHVSHKLSSDPLLRAPVKKNVSAVAQSLLKRSRIVRDAVESGKVRVVQGIYSLSSGKVEFLP